MTTKEAEIYRQRENALSDKSNALISATEKGVLKVAKSLKENGADLDLIMKSTGLSKEEIELL